MDQIAQFTSRDIGTILRPTVGAFLGLLEPRRGEIESVRRETFKFGATERHQLDVYFPTTSLKGGDKTPVLFFAYGGGFNTGERVQPQPLDLIYRGLGAFFSKRGLFVVIADYRLVPNVTFPGAAEDVKDAISWFVANASDVTADWAIKPDITNLFPLGHSAGASHTITAWLAPGILPDDIRVRIKGLILNGGPYTFRPELLPPDAPIPVDTLKSYYGSLEGIYEKEPLALLRAASQGVVESLPPIFLARAEREPEAIEQMNVVFAQELEKKSSGKSPAQVYIIKGHNHVSPSVCLSSGEGEKWAEDVVEWIKGIVA